MFIHYYSVIDFFKKKNNYCLISPSYSELVKELEVWRCRFSFERVVFMSFSHYNFFSHLIFLCVGNLYFYFF